MHRLLQKQFIACSILAASITVAGPLTAADWIGFRGPGGSGVAEAKNLPTTWDSTKNIVWKQTMPGLGTSMPIVVGSRIYVTCYSGYAESIDEPGDVDNLERHVVCLDRETGKIQWEKSFKAEMPESKYEGSNNTKHGYASSTPTSDGKYLYVFFGISGVYCFDLDDGSTVWNTNVGDRTHGWGSATSPILHEDLLIVNASIESQSLIALNKENGKEVWREEGIKGCWSSPVLVPVDGRQELVLNAPNEIKAFDPQTGKQLWRCDGVKDSYICPAVVSHDGIIYAIGGRRNTAIAIRAGGQGDVTESHVLWTARKGANVPSPVYVDGYLFWLHERGIVNCLDAKTGEVVAEERLNPRPGLVYASATAADGKLYIPTRENGTYVFEAKPEAKVLAINTFEDDESRANASIVVHNNQLLLRTDKALYCIGQ